MVLLAEFPKTRSASNSESCGLHYTPWHEVNPELPNICDVSLQGSEPHNNPQALDIGNSRYFSSPVPQ